MNPVIFQIGPFSLHWYGLLIVGGGVLATWIASIYAKKSGEKTDHVWNLLAWALIAGIIGARLYHVFSTPADGLGWPHYRENPWDIINFWNGGFRGLGIYGGLVGGLLAIFVYCYIYKLNTLRYLDFFAPNVLLAQAIGRMGNYINQELYGPATNVAWAFHINPTYPCQSPDNLPAGIQPCGTGGIVPFSQETLDWYATNGFHPTFLYEALWNLSMFALLTLLLRYAGHRMRTGDATLLYFIFYAMGRFWVEMFRPDAWMMGRLATAQWISITVMVVATILLIVRHLNWSWRDHQDDTQAKLSVNAPQAPVAEPTPA